MDKGTGKTGRLTPDTRSTVRFMDAQYAAVLLPCVPARDQRGTEITCLVNFPPTTGVKGASFGAYLIFLLSKPARGNGGPDRMAEKKRTPQGSDARYSVDEQTDGELLAIPFSQATRRDHSVRFETTRGEERKAVDDPVCQCLNLDQGLSLALPPCEDDAAP